MAQNHGVSHQGGSRRFHKLCIGLSLALGPDTRTRIEVHPRHIKASLKLWARADFHYTLRAVITLVPARIFLNQARLVTVRNRHFLRCSSSTQSWCWIGMQRSTNLRSLRQEVRETLSRIITMAEQNSEQRRRRGTRLRKMQES